MQRQDTFTRWGSGLLIGAPLVAAIVVYAALPSFIDETSMDSIQGQLIDVHDSRVLYLASVSAHLAAGLVMLLSGTFLAARLRGAPWPALAGAGFAIASAAVFVVSAGLMDALVRVSDQIAGGDNSASTLALGRALAEAHNLTLGMTMFGIGGWVACCSVAMLQTGAYARRAAYAGVGAGAAMAGSLLGELSDAFYLFTVLGAILMLVWSVWLVLTSVRGEPSGARSALPAARSVASAS